MLTEAEAYARCHGYRAGSLSPMRVPAVADRANPVRAAFLRALAEPGPAA